MRTLFTLALTLVGLPLFAASYNITVETLVAGRLEDTFSFVLSEENPQEKGFDTKMLAKRYRANGWIHPDVAQRDADEKEAKEKAALEAAPKKTPLDIAKEKLDGLEKKYSSLERRTERSKEQLSALEERVNMLREAVEKGTRNMGLFTTAYNEYLDRYEPKEDVDEKLAALLKKQPKNTGDVEEVYLGSYCRMKLVKEGNKTILVDMDYAYARVLAAFYSDGNNNGNSITKHPIFERFDKIGLKNVKLSLSKPFCIQIGRPSPDEARTLQDALAQTSLFSDSGEAQEVKPEKPTYQAAELDTQGSYKKIKEKYASDVAKTVRVVITVKKQ